MNRNDMYSRITEKLIVKIKEGTLPWRRSWHHGLPANFITKRHYNGINFYHCCAMISRAHIILRSYNAKNEMD